jgi:predicted  nucleic acid-binding Zn-ribbon protein
MEVDAQLIINAAFGAIIVLGGWVFRIVWSSVKDMEDDVECLEKHHNTDLKEVRRELADLALAMPEKYVAKQDLDKLLDYFNSRFDKLEEKLDQINNH